MDQTTYMKLALQLAQSAKGQTGINPMVGAVVVKNGRIVGTGAHLRRGGAHAEVHALNMAGAEAEGSTIYVTLEPCNHQGKTPPCTERLIKDEVRRVVVAALDPNPFVSGRGVERLRQAGIEVETGILESEAVSMNEVFNKYISTKMPFVTLKSAMTLDGKIATVTGDSRWISGEAARAEVHRLRHEHDAILVGVGTVIADDPSLTTRLPVEGINPARVVVDSALRIPIECRLVQDHAAPTLVLTTKGSNPDKKAELQSFGVKVVEVNDGPRVDLKAALQWLGAEELSSVLVEGGSTIGGAMLQQKLVDKLVVYIAPKIVGGDTAPPVWRLEGISWMRDAITFCKTTYETVGNDLKFTGYPEYDGNRGGGKYVHRNCGRDRNFIANQSNGSKL